MATPSKVVLPPIPPGFELESALPPLPPGFEFESTSGGAAVGNPNAIRRSPVQQLDSPLEAITKIGGSTVLGTALGVAAPELLRGAGRIAGSFPQTRVLGPFLENAGTLLRGKRVQSGLQGGVSGAASETLGQGAEAAGAGPVLAEVARFVGGAIGPETVTAGKWALDTVMKAPALSASKKLTKEVYKAIMGKLTGDPERLTAQERAYLDSLIVDLRGGAKSGAPMEAVYGGLEQGAANTRALAYGDAQYAIQQADIDATASLRSAMSGDVAAFRQAQQDLKTHGESALAAAQANRLHIGSERPMTEIGDNLRTPILARNQAAIDARSTQYKAAETARDSIVNQAESSGKYVDQMPEYEMLVQSLKAELKPGKHSPEVADNFRHILKQITVNQKKESLPFGGMGSDPFASLDGKQPNVSFQQLDDVRRQLGEVFRGNPPEGYKAIDANTRRIYYGRIADLQKKFAGGDGGPQDVMQRAYADATQGLEQFGSRTGKLATAVDRVDPTSFTTDSAFLPARYFKTKQGVNDLLELTGNKTLVTQSAKDYMVTELAGLNEKQVRNWMTTNRELMSALPEVQMSAIKYVNALKSAEEVALKTSQRSALLAKQEGDSIREAEAFADRLRKAGRDKAAGITGTAESTAQTLLGNEAAVKRVRTLIESGKVDQWAAAGPAITQSLAAKQAVFDAVKQVLADKVKTPASAGGLKTLYSESIQPFVEGSRLITPVQSQEILGKLSAIEAMKLPQAQKLGMVRRVMLQSISGYASGLGMRGLVEAIPE